MKKVNVQFIAKRFSLMQLKERKKNKTNNLQVHFFFAISFYCIDIKYRHNISRKEKFIFFPPIKNFIFMM